MGLETFFEYVDLRVNGYIPVGRGVDQSEAQFTHFSGSNLLFETTYVASLPKVEAEVGGFIPGVSFVDLYLGLGGYYLFQRKKDSVRFGDAFGGAARLSIRPVDWITLGVDYSYDSIFKSRVQGVISFSVPTGPSTLKRNGERFQCRYDTCECQQEMLHIAKMVTPPQRAEIIPLEKKRVRFNQAGLGGISLASIQAIFVSPFGGNLLGETLLGSGSGTFEDPYTSLPVALSNSNQGDIIYVFANGGTTPAINGQIVLQNGQRLIGSGVSFNYLGTVIPPFRRDAGKLVYLNSDPSQPSNPNLLIAMNNEIAGFAFSMDSSSGIGIQNPDISNYNNLDTLAVRNCLFQPLESGINTCQGIQLMLLGANTVTFQDNEFTTRSGISYFVQDNGEENRLTIQRNECAATTTGSSCDITLNCGGATTHLLAVEQNNFGPGSFTLENGFIQFGSANIDILFVYNNSTNSSAYTFNNVSQSGNAGPMNITILPGQPLNESGVSASNGNGVTIFQPGLNGPINVISP